MNEWLEFVSTHTASNPSAAATLTAMPEHRILQVKGRDAAKFLQGQLTCDVRRLEQQDVLLGAHCNPKGRMISSFFLAQIDADTIGLRVRANIAEPALAALKKYIVFSKAEITQTEKVGFALIGHPVSGLPARLPEPGKSVIGDGFTLLHHTSGLLEIWAESARAMELWQQLLPSVTVVPSQHLERHWVEWGVAEVQAATAEEFIPQMFNYNLVDGISFKKGCYTGQEIVARMHYKGQSKKHLYRIVSDAAEGPAVGAELGTTEDPQKTAAMVVASAQDAAGWTGLVVTTDEVRTREMALEDKNSGAKFTWSELPYAIP
jgi:folate-binding protein YgfZ